jgi:hypothetical protein
VHGQRLSGRRVARRAATVERDPARAVTDDAAAGAVVVREPAAPHEIGRVELRLTVGEILGQLGDRTRRLALEYEHVLLAVEPGERECERHAEQHDRDGRDRDDRVEDAALHGASARAGHAASKRYPTPRTVEI